MKRLITAAGLFLGVPLLCGFSYIALSVCLVLMAVPQLPAWAQQPAVEWVIGLPQEAYEEAIPSSPSFGAIPRDGYSGPESFVCLLPPVRGYLTDVFGAQRPDNWVHLGIDYGTYFESVDVRTPVGGKVVFAGLKGPYGNLVVIENAGFQLYLAHHREIDVVVGQLVSAAQVVGRSGSTGNSSGIHVHMEVRQWTGEGFIAVNPDDVLLPGQKTRCSWHSLAAP